MHNAALPLLPPTFPPPPQFRLAGCTAMLALRLPNLLMDWRGKPGARLGEYPTKQRRWCCIGCKRVHQRHKDLLQWSQHDNRAISPCVEHVWLDSTGNAVVVQQCSPLLGHSNVSQEKWQRGKKNEAVEANHKGCTSQTKALNTQQRRTNLVVCHNSQLAA